MNFDNCTLYYKESCPFCKRVLHFMDNVGITCEMKDTLISNNAEELMEIGGKTQVPCMVIDEKPMYESMDIINYIKDRVDAEK